MRKFNVTVNGIVYEVEVEEVAAGAPSAPVAAPAAPKAAPVAAPAAPKAAPAAAPAAAPVAAGAAGAVAIKAPMPGTILDVKVSVGASVKKGDIV
ncbi:MAG: acetyl-CoA carboxylase biotin carboxyl carrier protein subunit, partial [Clostridia bacterium]|nr:acetyl-CoA carboxylase biotin carboxyl carrier protein subunit [Clostridia bacterium]